MNPEEQLKEQKNQLRKFATDVLTRIDCGPRMTSDGIARYMMDLVANYGIRSYDEAATRVLEIYRNNPLYFNGDNPMRYHNLSLLWQERFPEEYEAEQEAIRAKRKAEQERDEEDNSIVSDLMNNLAQDLVNRDHFSLLGFEPTDGEGQ